MYAIPLDLAGFLHDLLLIRLVIMSLLVVSSIERLSDRSRSYLLYYRIICAAGMHNYDEVDPR
jgi:hypothetical protein